MPTGSGKSSLFNFFLSLLTKVRERCHRKDIHHLWTVEESSFEKMGVLMANNDAKLWGLYDKLSSFLTQINLYGSKGHDTTTFLMLYNGHPWTRRTGKAYCWLLSIKPLVFVSFTTGQMKVVVLVAPSQESLPSPFFCSYKLSNGMNSPHCRWLYTARCCPKHHRTAYWSRVWIQLVVSLDISKTSLPVCSKCQMK